MKIPYNLLKIKYNPITNNYFASISKEKYNNKTKNNSKYIINRKFSSNYNDGKYPNPNPKIIFGLIFTIIFSYQSYKIKQK